MFKFYKFKKSKYFKLIVFFLTIFICVVSVFNIIISSDIDHIINCHEDHCSQCAMIHICTIQLSSMAIIIPPMAVALIAYLKQKFKNCLNSIFSRLTLIDYKIQLNI